MGRSGVDWVEVLRTAGEEGGKGEEGGEKEAFLPF